jgi:hypothetical protein
MDSGLNPNLRANRVGAWMGIAFVVLFVVGFITFPTPSDNKDTVKWERWWTDSGHRAGAVIGAYLMVLGLLALVWFMWSLNHRLHDRGGMMITFGSLFVAVAMISSLVRASIPGARQFGDVPVPSGDFARQFDQIGFGVLLVAGALTAGAFVATASSLARRDQILPGWLTVAGYVVAMLQLAAALFLPFVLFPLWILIASIVLLVRSSRADTPNVIAST